MLTVQSLTTTHPHVVEGDAHLVGEGGADAGHLGVALTEVG